MASKIFLWFRSVPKCSPVKCSPVKCSPKWRRFVECPPVKKWSPITSRNSTKEEESRKQFTNFKYKMELDGSVETHSNEGTPSNSEENSVRHLVSPERIQYLGLLLVGYKKKRLKNEGNLKAVSCLLVLSFTFCVIQTKSN